jgi:cellulose synthase/poly-beta-1,6-N-acetylglucosamine synthase-like glycosyltransferase
MSAARIASDRPLVSVVVIGRNEGQRLRRCLESVKAMRTNTWSFEVIYADCGSIDGSLALAAELGAETVALTPERPTAALTRNAGWRLARGEYVLFLDGDTILAPEFVQAALPEFKDATVGVVWGHRREIHPRHSIYNRVLDLDWVYAPGFTPFCGGDAIFRYAALEQSHGFDETLIAGEEPELCRRLVGAGWKILHIDCAMTGHDLAVLKFAQYWRRATRAGHAYAEVSERFRASGDPFWTEEVSRNRDRAVLLAGGPLLAIITSLALGSAWPMVACALAFVMLIIRTAWKARWKSANRLTLLLYGVHSHLQQIPIAVGQMQFYQNRRLGTRAALVEYKRP